MSLLLSMGKYLQHLRRALVDLFQEADVPLSPYAASLRRFAVDLRVQELRQLEQSTALHALAEVGSGATRPLIVHTSIEPP